MKAMTVAIFMGACMLAGCTTFKETGKELKTAGAGMKDDMARVGPAVKDDFKKLGPTMKEGFCQVGRDMQKAADDAGETLKETFH